MALGAGCFTELLVNAKAHVHSFDLSIAVEVNKSNIGNQTNYNVCQANIYEIPYPDEAFDIVICIGVLQHTPNPEKSIESLWKKAQARRQISYRSLYIFSFILY